MNKPSRLNLPAQLRKLHAQKATRKARFEYGIAGNRTSQCLSNLQHCVGMEELVQMPSLPPSCLIGYRVFCRTSKILHPDLMVHGSVVVGKVMKEPLDQREWEQHCLKLVDCL